MMDLKGRVAVVTGAASGIGLATAVFWPIQVTGLGGADITARMEENPEAYLARGVSGGLPESVPNAGPDCGARPCRQWGALRRVPCALHRRVCLYRGGRDRVTTIAPKTLLQFWADTRGPPPQRLRVQLRRRVGKWGRSFSVAQDRGDSPMRE